MLLKRDISCSSVQASGTNLSLPESTSIGIGGSSTALSRAFPEGFEIAFDTRAFFLGGMFCYLLMLLAEFDFRSNVFVAVLKADYDYHGIMTLALRWRQVRVPAEPCVLARQGYAWSFLDALELNFGQDTFQGFNYLRSW